MNDKHLSRRSFLRISAMGATAAFVAACGPSAAPSSSSSEAEAEAGAPAQEARAVSFMSIGDEAEQVMFQEALDVANQQPSIVDNNIQIEWQPYPGGGWEKIMTLFASDTAYDVQRMNDDDIATLALENKIHQLDCLMEAHDMNVDDYLPVFWTTLNLGGYQFCMNPLGGANAVFYNKALFEEAGLDMPPTTWADAWEWDEFVEIIGALSKKDEAGRPVQYGFGFPENIASPLIYGSGGRFLNDDHTACLAAEPATIDIFQRIQDLILPGGPEYIKPMDLDWFEMFNSGRLAMMWQSMGSQRNFVEGIEWDICPAPKSPLEAMSENYDRTFTIPKSAPDEEAAFIVLKTLCEEPTVNVFARAKFGVPYLKTASEGPDFNDDGPPAHKNVWVECMAGVDGRRVDVPTPRGPAATFKNNFVSADRFSALMAGQITPQEFLEQGCSSAMADLEAYDWHYGRMEELLLEAGVISCEGTKMWPDTDWP